MRYPNLLYRSRSTQIKSIRTTQEHSLRLTSILHPKYARPSFQHQWLANEVTTMDFRKIRWIRVALVAGLALSGPLTAGGQGPRGVPEPYTPAKDATDLRAVLFNWERNMGMLRGHDERDMVAMLEYQGKGTIQVDGQPCTLTKYRASTNYQTYSQRIQYTCTRANGQA